MINVIRIKRATFYGYHGVSSEEQRVVKQKYFLIEALATEIADGLLDKFENAVKVAVRVRKNNPPLGGVADCVEAEVIKER
jgi:dihydroneopterin aldolase